MTISDESSWPIRPRIAFMILAGCLVVICVVGLIFYLSPTPQLGTNEEVFRTVDALYTAVRSRDEKRLDDCDQRLRAYRESGKFPSAAAEALGAIIGQAKAGSWQSAAERLYDFMLAQRRDNNVEHSSAEDNVPAAKRKKK